MTKSSQTPSKPKSSSKTGTKSKFEKSKPKKIAKSAGNSEPSPAISPLMPADVLAPSHSVTVTPVISTPTAPTSPKPTTHAPVSVFQITSKPTKVKATSRKSVNSGKEKDRATAKGEPKVTEATAQGESALVKDAQVKPPPLKLDVLAFTIEVSPLEVVEPLSDTLNVGVLM
uniref:Salivary glue protein Sgs-3-like n=1 Tax=Nicotiana tabacum TaxID=4097 RepID=A0A1S3XH77_TOBAC|nr:salivary glue protein Sgs-3-like [Nicotiana tomentosiformis]XP_016439281.1 PREDICTED: salivary glue protein Sgs-3-like [Nicotiana tabacum]